LSSQAGCTGTYDGLTRKVEKAEKTEPVIINDPMEAELKVVFASKKNILSRPDLPLLRRSLENIVPSSVGQHKIADSKLDSQSHLSIELKQGDMCKIVKVQAVNDAESDATNAKLRGLALFDRIDWSLNLSSAVLLLSANHQRVLAACKDNSIVVVDTSTGKENLTIELQDQADFLQTYGDYLLVLTSAAEIFVWDLEKGECTTCDSISRLFRTTKPGIAAACVSSIGLPLLVLEDGNSYFYSKSGDSWINLIGPNTESLFSISERLSTAVTLAPSGLIAVLCEAARQLRPNLRRRMQDDRMHGRRRGITTLELLIYAAKEMSFMQDLQILTSMRSLMRAHKS